MTNSSITYLASKDARFSHASGALSINERSSALQ
jgi:hypothetical protein